MRDPQIWALMLTAVGVLATLTFAMHRLTVREMAARFDAVDAKFEGRFEAVDAKFNALDAKFDAKFTALEDVMNARFADVDHRLSSVETDLGIIKAGLIGQRSA